MLHWQPLQAATRRVPCTSWSRNGWPAGSATRSMWSLPLPPWSRCAPALPLWVCRFWCAWALRVTCCTRCIKTTPSPTSLATKRQAQDGATRATLQWPAGAKLKACNGKSFGKQAWCAGSLLARAGRRSGSGGWIHRPWWPLQAFAQRGEWSRMSLRSGSFPRSPSSNYPPHAPFPQQANTQRKTPSPAS